jgi:hypothetical protein
VVNPGQGMAYTVEEAIGFAESDMRMRQGRNDHRKKRQDEFTSFHL